MEILVRKIDDNSLGIKHEMFDKEFRVEYDKFFGFLARFIDIDKANNVVGMEYKDNTLSFKKYDFFDDAYVTDNYVFDENACNDSSIREKISSLLVDFEQVKDTMRTFIDKCIELKRERDRVDDQARRIFKEYCESGEFTLPEDSSILEKLCEMFESCAMAIFVYYDHDENGQKHKHNTVDLKALTSSVNGTGAGEASEGGLAILSRKSKEIAAILKEKCTGNDGVKVYTKGSNVPGQTSK